MASKPPQIFPDAMRFLWKGYPAKPIQAGKGSDRRLSGKSSSRGRDWQLVDAGHTFTEGPTANATG